MSADFTIPQVIAEVRLLAEALPDYIYEPVKVRTSEDGLDSYSACRYLSVTDPTKGGCIFGHALLAVGVKPEVIEWHEGGDISMVCSMLGVEPDESERLWMNAVQAEQDTRTPWGEAVALGDSLHPLFA